MSERTIEVRVTAKETRALHAPSGRPQTLSGACLCPVCVDDAAAAVRTASTKEENP